MVFKHLSSLEPKPSTVPLHTLRQEFDAPQERNQLSLEPYREHGWGQGGASAHNFSLEEL